MKNEQKYLNPSSIIYVKEEFFKIKNVAEVAFELAEDPSSSALFVEHISPDSVFINCA